MDLNALEQYILESIPSEQMGHVKVRWKSSEITMAGSELATQLGDQT